MTQDKDTIKMTCSDIFKGATKKLTEKFMEVRSNETKQSIEFCLEKNFRCDY